MVALDTDVVGCHGYYCDFSRTFHTGPDEPTRRQRELYRTAHEQVHHNMGPLRAGVSFREYAEQAWTIPERFVANRYYVSAHGCGVTGEYPYLYHEMDFAESGYDGVIEPGMTLCVESYIGEDGGDEGVKLEQQLLITEDEPSSGPESRVRSCAGGPHEASAHCGREGLVLGCQTPTGRVRRSRDSSRSLDDLGRGELLAGEVDLYAARQSVPVVHALTGTVCVADLGEQKVATEQVLHDQRGDGALASGRTLGRPLGKVYGIAGLPRPARADHALDVRQ